MVGNSINCRAEMSADIASIPSWKVALLERKRSHDKDTSGSNVIHTPSATSIDDQPVVDSGVPAWKRDILARKQNQKNSSVFLAKHGQSEDGQSNDIVSTANNVHVRSLVYDRLDVSTEPGLDDAGVDIDINDAAEDQPVEERLLPIHQNPILRLDLKIRSQSSSSSSRSSVSPRPARHSTGSSHVHSSGLSSVTSQQAPVTPDVVNEEVFGNNTGNDAETEVAYGKGFVHKLLMKFSHLSSSGSDQTSNNRYPKPKFGSLIDKLSGTGPRRQSSRDLESIPSKPSSGMPPAKFHSADDLLNETSFHVRMDHSDSADELDITACNDLNGEISTQMDHSDDTRNEDDSASKRNSSSAETTDDLPFANIVSNARSLFESLAVHSVSQKQSPSPSSIHNTASSYFSYVGTLERSHQPNSTPVTKTFVQEVSTPKKFEHSYSSLTKPAKSAAEVPHINGTSLDAHAEEPKKNADARIESDAGKSVQESSNRLINSTVVNSQSSPSSTHTFGSVLNRDVNISATKPTQPASTRAESSTVENAVPVLTSLRKEQDRETVLTVSQTQSKTAADQSHLSDAMSCTVETASTNVAKPVYIDSSTSSSEPADSKENVKSQPTFSGAGKKPAPSRPGKLVIRPASNLVAAKTSSEYLEMTKFNDVRKGEFAPPTKKERVDLDMYDDDVDKSDGVTNDTMDSEVYVFTGAGVVIGRSLLTKTNKNRSVNTGNFSLFIMKFCFPEGHDYTIGTLDVLQACDGCADMGMTYSVIVQCTDCVVFPEEVSLAAC